MQTGRHEYITAVAVAYGHLTHLYVLCHGQNLIFHCILVCMGLVGTSRKSPCLVIIIIIIWVTDHSLLVVLAYGTCCLLCCI